MQNLLTNLAEFMFAGNAIFTVQNTKSGKHFTYKVKKVPRKKMWWVRVLTKHKQWKYLGCIDKDAFRATQASIGMIGELSFKGFLWLYKHRDSLPTESILVFHEGYCGRCGRRLTRPESVQNGFGPECIKYQ